MTKRQGMLAKQAKKIIISRVDASLIESCTIIVTGVQRGGTSMVGGVLGELGIDMGPVALNHEDPNFLVLEKDALQSYVLRRNTEKFRWGFKLPGAHVNNKIKEIEFRNPVWVFVYRNVVSNIDSLVSRGNITVPAANDRIVEYYAGMQDIIRDELLSYVLISYDRAVVEPYQFAVELAEIFGLCPDAATIEIAAKQVTGEGGGYLPASRHYHLVDVLPAGVAESKFAEAAIPLSRVRQSARLLEVVEGKANIVEIGFEDTTIPLVQDYTIYYQEGRDNIVTIIFDFGSGFTGLAAYDLPLNGDSTLVRVRHEGAVQRIGFFSRGSKLPSSVQILRSSMISL